MMGKELEDVNITWGMPNPVMIQRYNYTQWLLFLPQEPSTLLGNFEVQADGRAEN